MYALISFSELIYDDKGAQLGARVAEVKQEPYEVAHESLKWVECADNIIADKYYYNLNTETIELTPLPIAPLVLPPTVGLMDVYTGE